MSDASTPNLVSSRVAHTPNPGTSPAKPTPLEDEVKVQPPRPHVSAGAGRRPMPPQRTRIERSEELDEIDRALSSEAEQMLQAEYETIDAVLDGVFEERAVLVQRPDGSPATPPERPPAKAAAAPVSEPPQESTASIISVPSPVPQPEVPPPQPVLQSPPPAMVDEAEAPPEDAADPPLTLKGTLRGLLMLLGTPVRLASPQLRTVINWAAITLLMWVPLVWLAVLWKR